MRASWSDPCNGMVRRYGEWALFWRVSLELLVWGLFIASAVLLQYNWEALAPELPVLYSFSGVPVYYAIKDVYWLIFLVVVLLQFSLLALQEAPERLGFSARMTKSHHKRVKNIVRSCVQLFRMQIGLGLFYYVGCAIGFLRMAPISIFLYIVLGLLIPAMPLLFLPARE